MDLETFAREMAISSRAVHLELEVRFKMVVKDIEETAKTELGVYQPAVGPFNAWDPLADSTRADRVRAGYSENDPLLRSGELRASIESETVGLAGIVGTKSEIGYWLEVGTERMPPRPFIGPAYVKRFDHLMESIGLALRNGFKGY